VHVPKVLKSVIPQDRTHSQSCRGLPTQCAKHKACDLGLGTFEKVKPYKARDFIEMTAARHPDLLECRTNIRTPRLSTTVCHGNPIQRSTGTRSRTVLRSALTGKRVRPVCCLDYAVKPEVVLVARPPSRQGRRVTLQQSAKRRLSAWKADYALATAGGVHVPLRIEGAFSLGQYMRSMAIKSPFGAGNQFASLSAPGVSFWK
jgi:hypothetical protein